MKIIVKLIIISILLLILASCGETKYLHSLKPNYIFNLVVASEGVKYLVMTDSVGHLFSKNYLSRGSRITLYELPGIGIIYDPTTKLLPYARIVEPAEFCETDSIISSKLSKNGFGLSESVFFVGHLFANVYILFSTKTKNDMKTTKLIFVLLCAAVVMISCGGRSSSKTTVSKKQPSVYRITVLTHDSLKLAVSTDSLGYCFAVQNLKRGDKIYVSGHDCPSYDPTRTYNHPSSESMLVIFYGVDSASTLPYRPVPLQKYSKL